MVPHLIPLWGWFLIPQPLLCPWPTPYTSPAGGRALSHSWWDEEGGRSEDQQFRDCSPGEQRPCMLWSPARGTQSSLHPLRGLSAAPLGLLALSLFFLRRLSIQLELERVVKLDSARELSRMFLPDIMSSPKPSWWEKA